jgi:hypothetical protein
VAVQTRILLLIACAAATVLGVVLWVLRDRVGTAAPIALAVVGIGGIAALVIRPRSLPARVESDDITELSEARRKELMRGTSMYLREMRYRYSVRLDQRDSGERRCFAAEVNTIHLGFVPAVITDTTNDRQGLGFVAFVHDGRRWRGPGLPCPADQAEAVRHAARCVSPLARDEETKFEDL